MNECGSRRRAHLNIHTRDFQVFQGDYASYSDRSSLCQCFGCNWGKGLFCLFLFCFVLFLVGGVGSSLVGLDDLDQNIELIIWNVKTSEILSVPESFMKISGKDLAHTNCHLQSWCRRSAP